MDRTRKTAQPTQVSAFLTPDSFAVVSTMSQALELPRSEILRRLVDQAVTGLRAAAAAEDAGEDVEAAVIAAVKEANSADETTALRLLEVFEGHLVDVRSRRPKAAVLLAGGAATALRGWADETAEALGLTTEHIEETASLTARLHAHEATLRRLDEQAADSSN